MMARRLAAGMLAMMVSVIIFTCAALALGLVGTPFGRLVVVMIGLC